MAITTENTYLLYKSGSTWKKLVDIKEFPDLGGAPSTVEITTLSDHCKKYLNGLKDTGSLEFTANYDATSFSTINALTGTQTLAVNFGTSGNGSNFQFSGEVSVYVNGAGTESAVEMTVAVATSSDIAFASTGLTFS